MAKMLSVPQISIHAYLNYSSNLELPELIHMKKVQVLVSGPGQGNSAIVPIQCW